MKQLDILLRVLGKSGEPKHYSSIKLALDLNYNWEPKLEELKELCNMNPNELVMNGDYIQVNPKYSHLGSSANKRQKELINVEKFKKIKEYQKTVKYGKS